MRLRKKTYQYIFIYGTLKREFHNDVFASIEKDIEFVGESTIHGKMYDIGDYPGAIPDAKSKIKGEVFKLKKPRKVIHLLDEYEGYYPGKLTHSEYLRRKERINLEGKKNVTAWIYWYNDSLENKHLIRHQDYVNYLKKIK